MNKELKYIPIGILLAFCYALDFVAAVCCVPIPILFILLIFSKDKTKRNQTAKWVIFNVVAGQIVVFILRLVRDIIPIHRPPGWYFYVPAMIGIPLGILIVWWSYKRIVRTEEPNGS